MLQASALRILEVSDHDGRVERFVHGTLVGDLLETRALIVGEWAGETHRALDAMHVAVAQ